MRLHRRHPRRHPLSDCRDEDVKIFPWDLQCSSIYPCAFWNKIFCLDELLSMIDYTTDNIAYPLCS